MAEQTPPKQSEQEDRGQSQTERKSTIEQRIGAPLRDLSNQIASLTDRITANTQEEQRERRAYQASQLRWLRVGTIFGIILSALTLWVLKNTLDVAGQQREITGKQLKVMEGQLTEMQEGSKETRLLAKAAVEQAGAAKSQATDTEKLAKTSLDQIKELRASVQATQEMANSSREANSIAKGANEIAKVALQAAQRPWVGFSKPIVIKEPLSFRFAAKGMSINLEFWLKNFGVSVATATLPDAHAVFAVNSAEVTRVMKERCSRSVAAQVIGHALFPGEEASRRIELINGSPQIGFDRNGMTQMWITGCIFYQDQFGKFHRTQFAHSFFTDKKSSLFKPEGSVQGKLSPSIIGVTAD